MPWYPVQRQKFPAGLRVSRRRWDPGCHAGVQKPHCSPWHSRSAACTGEMCRPAMRCPRSLSPPCRPPEPRDTRHERTASPSSSTVQAPHAPCSQPRWVPVSPHLSLRKSASVMRGSTLPAMGVPLTDNWTGCSCIAWPRDCFLDGLGPGARGHGGAHLVRYDADPCRSVGMSSSPVIAAWPISSAASSSTGLPTDRLLGRGGAPGCGAQTQQPDGAAAYSVFVIELHSGQHTGDREIAMAARKFVHRESRSAVPHRKSDTGQHFVRRDRGFPQTGEEVRCRSLPPSTRREHLDHRIQSKSDGRVFAGGVGMRDRSAQGATVADLEVTDERRHLGQQRTRLADLRIGAHRRRRRLVLPGPGPGISTWPNSMGWTSPAQHCRSE